MTFSYKTVDGVEGLWGFGKGAVGLTGDSRCLITGLKVSPFALQASLSVDPEEVGECKEALIQILN